MPIQNWHKLYNTQLCVSVFPSVMCGCRSSAVLRQWTANTSGWCRCYGRRREGTVQWPGMVLFWGRYILHAHLGEAKLVKIFAGKHTISLMLCMWLDQCKYLVPTPQLLPHFKLSDLMLSSVSVACNYQLIIKWKIFKAKLWKITK